MWIPVQKISMCQIILRKENHLNIVNHTSLISIDLRLSNALYNIKGHSETETESEVYISFKEKHLDEKFSSILRDLIVELTSGHLDIQELKNFISSKKQNTNEVEENPPEDLFSLDISTAPETSYTIVPKYETSFNEILDKKDESDAKPEAYDGKTKRFPKVCFNCSGDHNVGQCPHKIDQRKVNIARRQIKSFCPPTVRYHVHGKKEAGFKPGSISDDLREALDLKQNQIPLYVYRMRLLGYPPGWLAEAAVESSGITVYGSDGNVVAEENCEDGEVDSTDIRVQYDPDKLIDFPGFNVPLPPNFVDEFQELGMPPLQFHQLRSTAEMHMSKPDVRPRWKRKLKLQEGNQSKIQRCEEDMEVDDDIGGGVLDESSDCAAEFIPPLPTEAPPPPPPPDDAVPPPLPDDAPPPIPSDDSNEVLLNVNNSDSHEFSNASVTGSSMNSPAHLPQALKLKNFDELSSGTSSPSLTELEEMKKRLVLELGFSSYDTKLSSKLVTDVTIPQDIVKLKETESQEFLESVATPENSNDISSFSESSSNFDRMESKVSTPEYSSPDQGENKSNKSKCVMLGTPSLSRHSSYSKLPDYERFSENV
ncbi:Zinc finger CCHC domain-containing protein 8-like protein, partial [Stegodyphus mimosarum]